MHYTKFPLENLSNLMQSWVGLNLPPALRDRTWLTESISIKLSSATVIGLSMVHNLGQLTPSICVEQFRDKPIRVKVKPIQWLWKAVLSPLDRSKPLALQMTILQVKEQVNLRTKVNPEQGQNPQTVNKKSKRPLSSRPFRNEPVKFPNSLTQPEVSFLLLAIKNIMTLTDHFKQLLPQNNNPLMYWYLNVDLCL